LTSLRQVADTTSLTLCKMALCMALPFQRWITPVHSTHSFINSQAIRILRADGHTRWANLAEKHFDTWNTGTYCADHHYRNTTHHFNLKTGRGLWRWPSAVDVIGGFWDEAMSAWRSGHQGRAFFWLGAVVHLIQDLCEPHHARATVLHGHRRFERWAAQNKDSYVLSQGGVYDLGNRPEEWAVANAGMAWEMFPLVTDGSNLDDYSWALGILLPRAQATTAGLVGRFLAVAEGA